MELQTKSNLQHSQHSRNLLQSTSSLYFPLHTGSNYCFISIPINWFSYFWTSYKYYYVCWSLFLGYSVQCYINLPWIKEPFCCCWCSMTFCYMNIAQFMYPSWCSWIFSSILSIMNKVVLSIPVYVIWCNCVCISIGEISRSGIARLQIMCMINFSSITKLFLNLYFYYQYIRISVLS